MNVSHGGSRHIISRGALIQRLNRHLAKDGERVRKSRGAKNISDLGDYYIVDANKEVVIYPHLRFSDLVAMARDAGLLAGSEEVSDD